MLPLYVGVIEVVGTPLDTVLELYVTRVSVDFPLYLSRQAYVSVAPKLNI